MTTVLKNATYIDFKTLDFSQTHIIVEEGKGKALKFTNNDEDFPKGAKIIDCNGKLVTKSFANAHQHSYFGLRVGMPGPKKRPRDYNQILEYIWWNLDKNLDKDLIEASALSSAMASAKSGTTFVIDKHASQSSIPGSLDIIKNAYDRVGVSHLLSYEISDRDGAAKAQEGIDESERYLSNNQGLIGLHSSFTCKNETFEKVSKLAQKQNVGINIHVAEDLFDENHCLQTYDKRVIHRLKDYGFLEHSSTILGHCLHIDDDERKLLESSPAYIVQNPESNLNNNLGLFYSDYIKNDIMLGTAGMHSDPLQSAKFSFLTGQVFDKINLEDTYKRFRNVNSYISKNNFEGDSENNLVVLDYDNSTQVSKENFYSHFVHGINSKHVLHVISDGKVIVKDCSLTTVNEEEILKFTRSQSERLWSLL